MSHQVTIADLCKLNMDATRANNSETGWHSYACHQRLFERMWGNRPASELGREDAQAWVKGRKEQVSVATVRHEIAFLKRAYNLAIDKGLLEANPFARLGAALKICKRHQWFTDAEEALLHQTYKRLFPMGDLWWTVEKFNLLTGCRVGEQAFIRPRHISPKVLTIPDEGKTGTRLVPLHPEAYAIAQLWMELSKAFGSAYVFWPVAGDRHELCRHWALDVWNPVRKACGLEDRQRRDERRTFGSRLIQKGVPVFDVMKLLGHTTPEQTLTYCQVDLAHLRPSVLKL